MVVISVMFVAQLGMANNHLPVVAELTQEDIRNILDFEDELNGSSPSKISFKERLKLKIAQKKEENPRLIGALLAVALGPFGAHRIYLGTNTKVPVFYTLTLGGGLGVLPAIDLFCILFTKDLERYYANDNIFMWSQ